jgi:hypothetical protein
MTGRSLTIRLLIRSKVGYDQVYPPDFKGVKVTGSDPYNGRNDFDTFD